MSAHQEGVEQRRHVLEQDLVCPHCGAANRPGATYVALDRKDWTVGCLVCSRSGPVRDFQLKEPT